MKLKGLMDGLIVWEVALAESVWHFCLTDTSLVEDVADSCC